MKLKFQALLQAALSQVEKRLPGAANMFKGLSLINIKNILSQTLRGKLEDLPFPHHMENNSVVEAQYRKMYLVKWCEEECFAESGISAEFL